MKNLLEIAMNSKWMKLKDYHNFYLERYVLLLSDVFDKIRNSKLKDYGHYFSVSALSWNVILDIIKVELEVVSNADMQFKKKKKKSMRRGVSYISKINS